MMRFAQRLSEMVRDPMDDYKERLRKLAVRDEALVEAVLANEPANREESGLDAKTHALVRLTTTVAVDGGQSSYQYAIERALAAGATADEVVGTLVAMMSLTGVPRAVSAAPKVGLALGYDVDAALEGDDSWS
jgi:4-carboxymuconolactone decarboxylase